MTKVYLTKEGLKKLEGKLEELVKIERPSISKQIAEARDKGDLSENAEYDAAKNAQGMLELRISKLQDKVRNARIIDESKLDSSKIGILSIVEIINLKNKTKMKYTIVPESESDLKAGKISSNSPIAQGLMGKKIGDTVEITVPAGKIAFEILQISR
jgi:transcription elongation factor GreA